MFYCSQLLSLSIPCAPHLGEIQTGSALSFDTSGRFKPERSHPQPALPTNHSETPTQPPSLALPRYFWTSLGGLPCPPQNLITIDLLTPCWMCVASSASTFISCFAHSWPHATQTLCSAFYTCFPFYCQGNWEIWELTMGFPGRQWLGLSTFIAVAQVQSLVGELNPPSDQAPHPAPPSLQIKNWLKVPQYAVGLGLTLEPMLVTKTVFC